MEEGSSSAPTLTGNETLEERLAHKNWKVRLGAYEQLENLFRQAEDDDKLWHQHGGIWKSVVADNNAAAQEKGLDALILYIDRAKEAPKSAAVVAPLLVEKCLSGRDKTKTKATQALLLYIEIESVEPVVTSLLKGCTHKVPKICAASLVILKDAIRQFGPKAIPIKGVLSAFPSFFDHADKTVRAEAFSLVVELYRWLGPVLQKQIENLRPAQVKELEAAFQDIQPGKAVPEKYLRSQVPQFGAVAEAPQEIDAYELVDAVDVLSKIPADFYDNLAAAKWTARRDALDALIGLSDVPKIKNGDFSEVSKALKKLISDANVVVVSKAIKCLALLAQGLRKDYASGSKLVLASLLDKFKEKKATTVIHEALDNMYWNCFTLPDVIEEVVATAENKVPKVKQETMLWLTRSLNKSLTAAKRATVAKVVKQLGNYLLGALEDSSPEVRDAAAVTFGTLVGIVGERSMQPYLSKLDKIKLAKVKEHVPEVQQPPPTAAPVNVEDILPDESDKPKEDKKADKKPVKKPNPGKSEEAEPAKEPAKPKVSAKPPVKAPPKKTEDAKPSAAKKGAKDTKGKQSSDEIGAPALTTEEALEKAKEILPESILKALSSSVWKERLAGMEELSNFVDKLNDSYADADVIVQQLAHKPGWKEANFQVLLQVFVVIGKIAKVAVVSKPVAVLVLPGIVEKLIDAKIKAAGIECLFAFAEANSPQFVFSQLFKLTSKHKNPKVPVEVLLWVASAVEEFGVAGLQIKGVIEYIRECLESTNAPVKTQAIKTLGTLRKFVGPSLRDFVADVKSTLLTSIDEEFSKVADSSPPAPKRTFKDMPQPGKGGNSSDILPREDISAQITPELLKQLGDAKNWKPRKEALDEVRQIVLSANKRIQPNLGGLMAGLKPRVIESNKNLVVNTLELLSLLAVAMGPPIEKQMKIIMPAVLSNFGDNKANVRAATAETLSVWVTEVSLEPFIQYLPAPLTEAPTARKDLLAWITKHLSATLKTRPKMDVTPLIKPAVACLEDKSSEVRHLAETLLKDIVPTVGIAAITRQCQDLKPASKLLVAPILENLRAAVPGSTSEEPKSSKTETADKTDKPAAKAPKGTATAAKPPSSKTTAAPAPTPLLLHNDQKEQRFRKAKLKWVFEDQPRQDLVESLSEQFVTVCSESLHAKLFSSDFKKHVEALNDLTACLEQNKQETVDNLDLILKWTTLRLCDANMAVLKKTIDYLQALFTILDVLDYHLTDSEASVFLPCLVEKVGNNNESVRAIMRNLFRLLCKLYPASKLFKFVIEGLKSSNAKTRVECIEELGLLIERQGTTVCSPKSLTTIAGFIGDSATRNAALITLVRAYAHLGNEIWKQLPGLPDAHKEALQDKIKHAPPPSATPTEPQNPLAKSKDVKIAETAKADPEMSDTFMPKSINLDLEDYKLDLPAMNINMSYPSVHTTFGGPIVLDDGQTPSPETASLQLLENLRTGDDITTIETLKKLCTSKEEKFFSLYSDKVVSIVAMKMHDTLLSGQISLRLIKYLLNALHLICTKPATAKTISSTSLGQLIPELINANEDPRLRQLDTEQSISKALSLLLVMTIDNCKPAASFSALLELLIGPNTAQCKEVASRCLLKLTKVLSSTIQDINLNHLLRDMHRFFETHPADGLPPRTVKTLLNEIVQLKGSAVLKHLTLIPQLGPSPPTIVQYINLMLKSQTQTTSVPSKTTDPEQDTKGLLTDIFKKIGSKDTIQQGLIDLYNFTKDHPRVDIQPYLQRTSTQFQAYIKKGLETIERQQQQSSENQGLVKYNVIINYNLDPNTIGSSGDQFAVSYMDRLRKLQQQYSLKKTDEVATPHTSSESSLQDLRARLKAVQSGNSTEPRVVPVEPSQIETHSVSSGMSSSTESTVADLRSRLMRIKVSIAQPTLSVDTNDEETF